MAQKMINIYFDQESIEALQKIKSETGKNNSEIVRSAVKKMGQASPILKKLNEIYCDI